MRWVFVTLPCRAIIVVAGRALARRFLRLCRRGVTVFVWVGCAITPSVSRLTFAAKLATCVLWGEAFRGVVKRLGGLRVDLFGV